MAAKEDAITNLIGNYNNWTSQQVTMVDIHTLATILPTLYNITLHRNGQNITNM